MVNNERNSRHEQAVASGAMSFLSLFVNTQDRPYTMASSRKEQTKQIVTILGIIGGILVFLGSAAAFVTYISRSEINTALKTPLERLKAVEENTKNLPALDQAQRDLEKRVIRLQTTIDVLFEKQPLDKTTVENVTGRAVNKAVSAKDASEREAALKIAGEVLERADNHHVIMDYKKASNFGLSLLQQNFEGTEQDELDIAISRLAKQRTLKFPVPEANQFTGTSIKNREQILDGEDFKNVTFVNCTIIYNDGWLNLENVRFINCVFDVSLSGGKQFYQALFKSEEPIPMVDVKSSGRAPNAKNTLK